MAHPAYFCHLRVDCCAVVLADAVGGICFYGAEDRQEGANYLPPVTELGH